MIFNFNLINKILTNNQKNAKISNTDSRRYFAHPQKLISTPIPLSRSSV
jgi:hypothetical protein